MLFKYSFGRFLNLLKLKPLIPYKLENYIQITYLRLMSFLKYIYISKRANIYLKKTQRYIFLKELKLWRT